jgi:hypothetical protein
MSKYQTTINENLSQKIKNVFNKITKPNTNVETNIMQNIIDDTNNLVSTIYEKGAIESPESKNVVDKIIDTANNIGSTLTGQSDGKEPRFDYSNAINKYKNILDNIRTRRNILYSVLETTTKLINDLIVNGKNIEKKNDIDAGPVDIGQGDINEKEKNGDGDAGQGKDDGDGDADEEKNNGQGDTDEEKNNSKGDAGEEKKKNGQGDTDEAEHANRMIPGETIIKTTIKENNKNSTDVKPNPSIETLKIEKSIIVNKIL